MRTLALTAALATALAGTGCIVTADDPSGDLDLAWRFQDYDGLTAGSFSAADTGCGVAAVTDVDVSVYTLGGTRVAFLNFPCREAGTGLPRAFVSGLRAGSYTYLATAFRVDAPVFEDGGSFFVDVNATTQVDATLGVLSVAPLSVYFTQGGVSTCSGTPNVRFDLFYPSTSSSPVESNTVPCTGSYGFTATADQPTGRTFGVDIYALTAGGLSFYEQCLQTVRHTGFPFTINLVPPAQSLCL